MSKTDIQFAGQYFEQIRDALVKYMRNHLPAGWDENENEPLYQIISAFAYGLHQTNALLDYVANNLFLFTVRDRGALRELLALVGLQLKDVQPATARLLAKLTGGIQAGTVIPAGATFGTTGNEPVVFTTLDSVSFDGTGFPQILLWTDYILFFQDSSKVLFDGLDITITTVATEAVGFWEYPEADPVFGPPDSVTWDSNNMTFDLDSLYPAGTDYHEGEVTMVYLPTGYAVTITVTYDGNHNQAVTPSTFGQESPSTNPQDYQVQAQWRPLNVTTNELRNASGYDFAETGTKKLRFDLPEGQDQQWRLDPERNVYLIKYHRQSGDLLALEVTAVLAGDLYVPFEVVQGAEAVDVFKSNGLAGQALTLSGWRVAEGSVILTVDDGSGDGPVQWAQVNTFAAATALDSVFRLDVDDLNQQVKVVFGDGEHGRIPPTNADISVTYGVIPDGQDGNVAANTITDNLDGNSKITDPWNPKPASGWQEAEGSTDESTELIRATAPGQVWTRETVINPQDVESVIWAYRDPATGNNPIKRALVIEKGSGQNSIDVVAIGDNASVLSSEVKTDIQDWLNGNEIKAYPGRVVLGAKVFVHDFILHPVSISAMVKVTTGSVVTAAFIEQALKSLLYPLAKDDDQWSWGVGGVRQKIVPSWLVHEIFLMHPDIVDVQVTTPSADVVLTNRELPEAGGLTITVEAM